MCKKVFWCLIAIIAVVSILAIVNNTKSDEPIEESTELIVENAISMDHQWMRVKSGDNYSWYETCIVLNDYLDEAKDVTISEISNIFQHFDKNSNSEVFLFNHTDKNYSVTHKSGLWIGDFSLNKKDVIITFKEAYNIVITSNYIKPHCKNVVLRREVGSKSNISPQYIFGNKSLQLYVDAKTGSVTDINPAY